MSHGKKPLSIPPRAHGTRARTVNSINGVLADFSMLILFKTIREPTKESLIKIHQLFRENAAGWHSHLALKLLRTNNWAK